jgi:hemerythrin-like metal-binding protein
MPRFQWKRAYETGNADIDAQHRQLLVLANLLFDAVKKGRDDAILKEAFDALLLYTRRHFEDEEKHFVAIGSPLWAKHRQEHRQLAGEVRNLWQEDAVGFVDDMGATLETWVERRLVPHMMEDDQQALRAKA